MFTHSQVSAGRVSRIVLAPSRAEATQDRIETGLPESSVRRLTTSSRRAGAVSGRGEPMIARSESHDSVTDAGSSGLPWRSAWNSPSSIRAVCSARAMWRPSQ